MIELIKEYYLLSVICGGISLLFTGGGGGGLIKGLEAMKSSDE